MIEKYAPPDHQNDNFYERFMEKCTRDLNNPSTTEEHVSFAFPIEPLWDLFGPQTSRNDLVCIVTIQELLLHLLLLAPLCYHLQLLWKRRPPIHLLFNMHKLLLCRPGKISLQFNNFFVTVPPAGLEIVLNRALKSPNTTAHSPTIPIRNQYCKPALDRYKLWSLL